MSKKRPLNGDEDLHDQLDYSVDDLAILLPPNPTCVAGINPEFPEGGPLAANEQLQGRAGQGTGGHPPDGC